MRDEPFAPRRIVVGLDASRASLDALAAAAALADRVGARIEALFVEDEDLLRFASLPFAGVVRTSGASVGRLERVDAEAIFRAIGALARAAVARVAARGVACTLRVAQGRVVDEVLAAAEDADLLVLGAGGHSRFGGAAVGATARTAAARARPPVMLLARGARLGDHVIAVDDGTAAAERTMEIARRLATRGRPIVLRATPGGALEPLAGVSRLRPALLVVPAALAPVLGGTLDRLLASGMAVLIVR
jgi:nucleotide-binding universal stress UspA family protein